MERYEYEMDDLSKSQRRNLEKESQEYGKSETHVDVEDDDEDKESKADPNDVNAVIDRKAACSINLKDIEVRYGFGMYVYFDFVRLLFFLNLIVMVPCLFIAAHDPFFIFLLLLLLFTPDC